MYPLHYKGALFRERVRTLRSQAMGGDCRINLPCRFQTDL